MKRNYLPRLTSFPLLVALLVIVTVTFATAGSPPIDVSDTAWDTDGMAKGKITAPGHKPEKVKGFMYPHIHFGEQTSPEVLEADEYLAELDDGSDTINARGTFTQTKGKIVLVPDEADLGNELEDLMDEVVPGGDWHCTVTKAKTKAKVQNKKSGSVMKFKCLLKWTTTEGSSPTAAKSTVKIKSKTPKI